MSSNVSRNTCSMCVVIRDDTARLCAVVFVCVCVWMGGGETGGLSVCLLSLSLSPSLPLSLPLSPSPSLPPSLPLTHTYTHTQVLSVEFSTSGINATDEELAHLVFNFFLLCHFSSFF
jgi:hypothetical protein